MAAPGQRTAGLETEPVNAPDNLHIVSIVQQHRIEARQADGRIRWSFTAGGRVSGKPIIADGLAIFGCHDGWVYAVHLDSGTLAWRFLAAPSIRFIVGYGQLESSWPIYGVAMCEDKVIASAGRHPEIGGGVFVVALDPQTGALAWKRTLSKPAAHIGTNNGKTSGEIVPRSFLNASPIVEGDTIRIDEYSFSPTESEEAINQRLNTRPAKKR